MMDHHFLFASLDSKHPPTARKVHIRRLYDVLHLCIQRGDIPRANRAWLILVRCKEVSWMTMWTTGLYFLGNVNHGKSTSEQFHFLRSMALQHPTDRESIIVELVLRLIQANKHREALDELELYLPSFPYQDNPLLHTYAGMISLYLAQESGLNMSGFNPGLMRDAQGHFEQACALDSQNAVAQAFLEKIPQLVRVVNAHVEESDDENMPIEDEAATHKRIRI